MTDSNLTSEPQSKIRCGYVQGHDATTEPLSMTPEQLTEILRLHKAWLNDEPKGIRASLRDADLSGADLRTATLFKASLGGADLREADLREADLRGADLPEADLQGANLLGASLQGADLRGASLQGADLLGADLRGASLLGADLREADLRGASLQGADLRGASLQGANLLGADLLGADLPIHPDAQQRLQAVARQVLAQPKHLQMGTWHSHCGTAHCLAGWAIHQAGDLGRQLEADHGPAVAGLFLLGTEASRHFFDDDATALQWLQSVVEVD